MDAITTLQMTEQTPAPQSVYDLAFAVVVLLCALCVRSWLKRAIF